MPHTALIETLKTLAPFDLVSTVALEAIAETVKEQHFESGASILSRLTSPKDLYVILDGTVDVHSESGRTLSLVAHEAFPLESLQTRSLPKSSNDYVANGGVTVMSIPTHSIEYLRLTCAEFDEYCALRSAIYQHQDSMGSDIGGTRGGLHFDLTRLLPNRKTSTLPFDATIDDVIQELHRTKAREVVLVDAGIPVGIFTRSDLVSRVLVPKIGFETPVSTVMTSNLVTMPAHNRGFDAVMEMHRSGVSRIVLLDDNGHFVGVISDSDLLYAQQDSSDLHHLIIHSVTEADLIRAAAKIRALAIGLISEGIEAEHLTRLVSTLNDHLVERIVTLTAAQDGISLNSFCWLALGSEGRHEQTLHTDQDNGLIFVCEDPETREATRQSMIAFSFKINTILDKCGFPLCSGNIMASNPECCLTVDEWRNRFSAWMDEPTPTALLNATIYFDLRPLCGNRSLCDELSDWLIGAVKNNKRFFHFMMENALQRKPPIGLFRDFTVDKADSCLDIKLNGITLLVDGARILGLAAGCRSPSTIERFRSSAEKKFLNQDDVDTLIAAFEMMQKIRLRHHNAQLSHGEPTSNRINPFALNTIDRKGLLESFRHANTLQKTIAAIFSMERRR